MASLTLTAPDALVPNLVAVATWYLPQRGVNPALLSNAEKVRRMCVELLKERYVAYQQAQAEAAAQAARQGVLDQAATDAGGIT